MKGQHGGAASSRGGAAAEQVKWWWDNFMVNQLNINFLSFVPRRKSKVTEAIAITFATQTWCF